MARTSLSVVITLIWPSLVLLTSAIKQQAAKCKFNGCIQYIYNIKYKSQKAMPISAYEKYKKAFYALNFFAFSVEYFAASCLLW